MRVRTAGQDDREFLVEMARLACTLEDRPLPAAYDPAVAELMPCSDDLAVIAVDASGNRRGAPWCHFHEPPLMRDANGIPRPELAMAVEERARGQGVGTTLVGALCEHAAELYSELILNVHLHNPAVRLYSRSGFVVTGAGRGRFGVAMRRPLKAED
jgi:GNAT superfamily N-acetyltransferase